MSVGEGHDPERFYHCDCKDGGYIPPCEDCATARAEGAAAERARIDEVREWANARIEECRRQEKKFGAAWRLTKLHQHGPPQALVEAWTERRALVAVLTILEVGVDLGEARRG
jgi:hypothetical protein